MARSVPQFRIFLASPGDVSDERQIVRDTISNVLPKDPFIRGRATFDIISWDDPNAAPGLDAHLSPQEAINQRLPRPSECDVVVVILWSRMGTPLPTKITREDGSTYQSGTEWEFEDALNVAENCGTPTILLYRRSEEPMIGLADPDFDAKRDQYQRVDTFFSSLKERDGALKRSVASYAELDEFQKLLRQNLQFVASGLLGQDFSADLGVTKVAVRTMFAILKERQVPPDQLEAKLKEVAERHVELTERLHVLSTSNDEPEITKRREEAADAIEQGDYDRAVELLKDAVAIDRRVIDEQQGELNRRKLSAAATIDQQGELERARLNYLSAAKYFADAARLVPTSDLDLRLIYLEKQALALSAHGEEFIDNHSLVEAIEIFQIILGSLRKEHVELDRATTQIHFGNALWRLGERQQDAERLNEAILVYRAALEERPRIGKSFDRAAILNKLGIALSTLGQLETDTERLKEAVEVHLKALKERPRKRVPLDWAQTQNNLGVALLRLGERETGNKSLERAIKACRAAVQVRSGEDIPFDWAKSQMYLGDVLTTLGQRKNCSVHLEEAIDAYRSALEVAEEEHVPRQWFRTQLQLANALQILGANEDDIGKLEQAIDAYASALRKATRKRSLLTWARIHENVGLAYKEIATRSQNKNALFKAIEAINVAIDVYKERQTQKDLKRTADELEDCEMALVDLVTTKSER